METMNYDNLLASDYPAVTDIKTIASGQNLAKGTVLGKITAGGKYAIVDNSKVDGTEVADCILAEDCDASGGDKQAVVFLSGAFNENALTFGGDDTADDHRATLRDKNIYLKKSVTTAGLG